MPEIMNLDNTSNDPNLKIWNLTYAVGEGCANREEDVYLVQWLLSRYFLRPDKKNLLRNNEGVGLAEGVLLTGQWDDSTAELLKVAEYDISRNQKNNNVKMNAQIFPVRQVSELRKYELFFLNFAVHNTFPKYFCNPAADPMVWDDPYGSSPKGMFRRLGKI